MRHFYFAVLLFTIAACNNSAGKAMYGNPFFTKLNAPVDYANVTATDVEYYANQTMQEAVLNITGIKKQQATNFANVFIAMDDVINSIQTANNNCSMLYSVSPDSLIRLKGLAAGETLDSFLTDLFSDKEMYNKMQGFRQSSGYSRLSGNKKLLVDDMMAEFEKSGIHLSEAALVKFKLIDKEISILSNELTDNLTETSDEVLVINEAGTQGLPAAFKLRYKVGADKYEIPFIDATLETVMGYAEQESTRKAFYFKYNNRAAGKNLALLDSIVARRHELALIMGHKTYASYVLRSNMAKNPATVWAFLKDLEQQVKPKALKDLALLKDFEITDTGAHSVSGLQPWDLSYYANRLKKKLFGADKEKITVYLPMQQCLAGMFDMYEKLLGLRLKKISNASVWHQDVEMYEVYEGDKLKGRFYLDLYPRPGKEGDFYETTISSGKATVDGYEIPTVLLLGNFTPPTNSQPSLLSFGELNTLFHEFGHVVNTISYEGEFAFQSEAKDDFVEAMSQIFENWIWDYDVLSSFARHYKTGEVLPRQDFERMLKAKNLLSGLNAIGNLRYSLYDMSLYDKYNPARPFSSDKLWQDIDSELGIMPWYVNGTHPQASWTHINTNPVYYYGYLWSEVYAKDMFTQFEQHGLQDTKTGIQYRKLILANGMQRDIEKALEEFLGRPSNHEAYIKSLGLEEY